VRYDTRDQAFRAYDYTFSLFVALKHHFPHTLEQLRDIPPVPAEGIHLIASQAFEVESAVAREHHGRLIEISLALNAPTELAELDSLSEFEQAVFFGDDFGSVERPLVCVFVPQVTLDWCEKWRLNSTVVHVLAATLRMTWRRVPSAADTCELRFSTSLKRFASEFVSVPPKGSG
jgi:hypothetical protein